MLRDKSENMNQFEYLIPENILNSMALDSFQLQIDLLSTSAGGLWPEIQVCIDDRTIWSGHVLHNQRIEYSTTGQPNQTLILKIRFLDKTNDHTKVNHNGDIIENTRRQPRIAQALHQKARGPRGVGGRLHHQRVTGHKRRGGRSARKRGREVERAYHHPDAIRAHH